MKVLARFALATLLVAPFTAGAQATTAAAQCEPDQGSPQFVARAYLSLSRAIAAINQDADPRNELREVLRVLTDPRARDRDKNVVGQQYTLGQTYILLLSAGTPEVVRRAEVGIQTEPEQTIDLVLAADSMFDAVVAAHPGCVEMMGQWRQHKPWLAIVNNAINALNANQLDSAQYYAQRAMILDDRAPYPYTVLAVIAQQQNRDDEALNLFRQALEKAGTDTLYNDVRVKTLGDVARLYAERAESAAPAQRAALAREAIAAYERYLTETAVDDVSRGFAISQLAAMYVAAGDSASLPKAYAPVLANPAGFGERTLLEAGVVATRANRMADAAKFFEAVNAANPYQRDALYNLSAAYIGTDQHEKVLPLARRLQQVDPNNPDNLMLFAYAYSGLLNKTRDANLRKAYTDSLVKYNTAAEQMPVRVMVSEFTRLREETRVGGSIENKSRAPRSYTLQVEILGKDGQVLGTEQATVGPVGAGERGTFRVTFPTGGDSVAGYRYRPLTS